MDIFQRIEELTSSRIVQEKESLRSHTLTSLVKRFLPTWDKELSSCLRLQGKSLDRAVHEILIEAGYPASLDTVRKTIQRVRVGVSK